jgi:hypothetical protein
LKHDERAGPVDVEPRTSRLLGEPRQGDLEAAHMSAFGFRAVENLCP